MVYSLPESVNVSSVKSRQKIWPRETVSAVPSRVSLLISILRLDLVLTGFLPGSAAASVYFLCITLKQTLKTYAHTHVTSIIDPPSGGSMRVA